MKTTQDSPVQQNNLRQTYQEYLQTLCKSILQNDAAVSKRSWMYEDGVVVKGFERLYESTHDSQFFTFIKKYVDTFVTADGHIPFVEPRPLSLDSINNGKTIFPVYKETGQENYKTALDYLWNLLWRIPTTDAGGIWHKTRYPGQMWLDGLFMGQPFAAEYAATFNHPEVFDTIALQFRLIHEYTYNEENSLYYHACDTNKSMFWCDRKTGCSPNFWGRAMGWLGMAAVDALDYFPKNHAGRDDLICVLTHLSAGLKRYEHPKNHVWYQITDQADREGNYPEMSCSCMFAYTLLKASRLGYINREYAKIGHNALNSIWENFVNIDETGRVTMENICIVAGLGPDKCPERNGTFEYYVNEQTGNTDNKGIGALLCLLIEAAKAE